MLTNHYKWRITWGQCDPAGIVYYPRYFEIFDNATTALFERALGMTKFEFLKAHNAVGYPMVDTRAKFAAPTKFGDDVVVETAVVKFGKSSFDILHKLKKGDQLCVECTETRVWVGRDPADLEKIKAVPIPESMIAKFK
jgi:4-hydroxybenzoyl-CoA thioesterase